MSTTETNYTVGTASTGFIWTGLNTENQAWSYFKLDQDCMVSRIDTYWGTYTAGTTSSGKNCIWAWNNGSVGALLASSGTISGIDSSQSFRLGTITPIFLSAGGYAVGCWCSPSGDRKWNQYSSADAGTIYTKTATGGIASNTAKTASDATGVMATRLVWDYPARISVYSGGWQKGDTYVYSGAWQKAKGVYVYNGGWQKAT